jgi:hypothetical protein
MEFAQHFTPQAASRDSYFALNPGLKPETRATHLFPRGKPIFMSGLRL